MGVFHHLPCRSREDEASGSGTRLGGGRVAEWEFERGQYGPGGVVFVLGSRVSQLFDWLTLYCNRPSHFLDEKRTNTHNSLSPPSSPVLRSSSTGLASEVFVPNRPTLDPKNSVLLEVEKIPPYLDSSLKALGLHIEARTSFITRVLGIEFNLSFDDSYSFLVICIRYWLPSILKHKCIALRFLPQSVYERAAPLRFDPIPDVIARIFMLFRGVDENQLGSWAEARERKNDGVEF